MGLVHHYNGIEEDFEVGKHLDTFKTLSELEHKINHYLGNDKARETIRQNGYDYCHNTFTYDNMVGNILELYKKYK